MADIKTNEKDFDFELLLTRYLDNDLSQEELVDFEAYLQENQQYRRVFVETCRIVGTINDGVALRDKDFSSEVTGSTKPESPILGFLGDYVPWLGSGFSGTLTFAVALVAVTLVCFGLWGGIFDGSMDSPSRSVAQTDRPHVGVESSSDASLQDAISPDSVPTARLIEMADCLWESAPLNIGESVKVGQRIQLKSGLAKIAFTDRAEVILEGPADFAVVSETAAELRYGRVSADVFDAGKGFTIDAPGMRVLDLGTQFGFCVDSEGQGEVHVFKGEVEVKLKKKNGRLAHSRLLKTHGAAALDSRKGRIDTLRYDPSLFIRTFEPSDLEITREYVETIKAASPVAYWRFEYLKDGCVLNEMSDHYTGSSPMRLVLSEDIQNKTLAVEQRSLTRPYMMVNEPLKELVNSTYSAECWVKSDGYQWITPIMLYFPKADDEKFTPVAGLVELLNDKGNQFEPRERVVRALHRIPPTGVYRDGIDCYSKEEYQPDEWMHLVLVNDEEEMRIYMNGRLIARDPISGRIDSPPKISIGRFKEFIYPERRASDQEMAGQIDEVAIYDRCLDEQEIKEHYHLGIEMHSDDQPAASTQAP